MTESLVNDSFEDSEDCNNSFGDVFDSFTIPDKEITSADHKKIIFLMKGVK